MPAFGEKQRRKDLKRQWKQQEQARLEAGMPLSHEDLTALFDYLDEALADGCDRTLRFTRSYLASRNLEEERIIPWLVERGGGCDCEVLANVEDQFP